MNSLTDQERAVYDWQIRIPGFGENGQQKLKAASVLVSRCGGLGGIVAYQLAAAGVTIDPHREDHNYGRFAWITDPEGNRLELWQPLIVPT